MVADELALVVVVACCWLLLDVEAACRVTVTSSCVSVFVSVTVTCLVTCTKTCVLVVTVVVVVVVGT